MLSRFEARRARGNLGRGGRSGRSGAAAPLAQRESARVLSGGGAGAGRLEASSRSRRVRRHCRGAQAVVGCLHQGLVAWVQGGGLRSVSRRDRNQTAVEVKSIQADFCSHARQFFCGRIETCGQMVIV